MKIVWIELTEDNWIDIKAASVLLMWSACCFVIGVWCGTYWQWRATH